MKRDAHSCTITGRRKALCSTTQSELVLACQVDANGPRSPAYGDLSLQQLVQDHVSGRQRMPITFELPQSRDAFWAALETLGEPQSTFAYWAELRAQRKREITSTLSPQELSLVLQNQDSHSFQPDCLHPPQCRPHYRCSTWPIHIRI